MAQRYWKLEKSGELGVAEVAAAVAGHIVLRADVAKGKTTIYFAGESEDEHAKVRANAKKIKLADVTKL